MVEFGWRHSIPRPRKPLVRRNHLADILYTSRVIADFVPNFLPWQRGLVAVEFVWRHSIARPRKTPVRRKDLSDMSYINRVITDFVPNFVAMATRVSRSRVCLASFNSPTPKTPC